MRTRETKQPLRRSARAAKIADATETARKKPSVASRKENKAQGQPKEPPRKRKDRGPAENPPKKKKRRASGPTEHFRLRKVALPLRKGVSLRDQVKKEFAHLLKCDEILVVNKELGINAQRAQVNQAWEERFLDFLVFSKEYGHKHVPKMFLDNPALGRWVVKIRAWKKNKDKSLTSSRLKRLEAAGFIWDPKAHPDFYKIQGDNEKAGDLWDENYADLVEYMEEHGDCMVPKSFPPNQRLARWVSRQRRHYKAKQENRYHTLTEDKEKRLLDIGFVFQTRTTEILRQSALKQSEDKWIHYCKKLMAFKEEYGHCAVPRRWKRDTQLASWVMRQRIQWKNKQKGEHSYLTDERIEQLTQLGFVFGAIDRKVYPVAGIKPRVVRSNDAVKLKTTRRTKTSVSAELPLDDKESDKDGGSLGEEQLRETIAAALGKRSTPKANSNDTAKRGTTRKTMTSISAAEALDDKEPKETGVAQGEEQKRDTIASEMGKRRTPKANATDTAKRETTRKTMTSISAAEALDEEEPNATEVSQGEEQLRETVVVPSSKPGTNDAAKRKSPRGTKTSISVKESLDEEEPDETGVSEGEEQLQETVVVPSRKRGTPKTSTNKTAKRKSPRRTQTSISVKEALDEEEPGETKVSEGEEQLQETVVVPSSKTNTNKTAKRKADEASDDIESDAAGVSQGEQPKQKTVVAPPGSLGLIITNIAESKGTVVSDVRSSSVLADKISPGDRIIAIDGEDVSLMNASEISIIMAGKSDLERQLTVRVPSPDQQLEFPPTKAKKKTKKMARTGQSEIAVRERVRMRKEIAEAEAKRTNLQLIRAEREEAAAAIAWRQDEEAKGKQVTLPTATVITPKERKARIKWVIYPGKKK